MFALNAETKKITTIILKTLGIYLILSVFFYVYIGLLDPKGALYSPFLAKYSLVEFILQALIIPAKFFLRLVGYDVVANKNNLSLSNEKGILIYHACLGIDVMVAYSALIFGYPGKSKLTYFIMGILFVHLLNIIRMAMIVITIKKNPAFVYVAHDIFNYVAYFLIICLFYFYVKKTSNLEVE